MASPGGKCLGFRPDLVSLCAPGQTRSHLPPLCPHLQSGARNNVHITVSGRMKGENSGQSLLDGWPRVIAEHHKGGVTLPFPKTRMEGAPPIGAFTQKQRKSSE